MLIAATGDIHSPQYFEQFVRAVDSMQQKPDLFLMTGDMINRGELSEYDKVYNVLFGKINCPIVSCFGNNEYAELRDTLKKNYPDIKFLDDSATMIQIGSITIGIVGTTGSLDTPTPWQRTNIPNIEHLYRSRIDLVDRLFQRMRAHIKILLVHYAPTYKTLEGENPRFYSTLGCQAYENVINARKPSLVVHGHGHNGKRQAWVDTVPVFNVALPLNREIVLIDTEKDLKAGISKFV
jgi:Icc-related predicted phosphoesterase